MAEYEKKELDDDRLPSFNNLEKAVVEEHVETSAQ
jgi:hypothetical protein